jgi:hypothetical protein
MPRHVVSMVLARPLIGPSITHGASIRKKGGGEEGEPHSRSCSYR